jgi:selenocysteine lyase/cysteine desulfurase
LDSHEVAYQLDNNYNIMVRAGLHCAPNAHKTVGSFDLGGAVRIGLGYFNTKKEVDYFIKALKEINCTE